MRRSPAFTKRCSSSPRALTAPKRSGWSIKTLPKASTASLTVCQSQPRTAATSLTVRPFLPTSTVAHRPALSVNLSLDPAIRSSTSVHEPTGHVVSGQRHRRLCQWRLTGEPKVGRSTKATTRHPLSVATEPQERHPSTEAFVWMCSSTESLAWRTAPSTLTSGRPTSSSLTLAGSVSSDEGSLRGWGIVRRCHQRFTNWWTQAPADPKSPHGSNPAPAATVTSKAAAKARSSSPAKLATSVPERTDYAPIPYETVTPPDATVTRHRPADRSHLIHSDGLRRRGLLRTRHFAVKLTGFVVTSGTKPLPLAGVDTATV